MKKVLSVFLCFFVLFHSVATPASAVKVEEVATFEDVEGHEIRVLSYGVAPANAAAGVLYLSSTGGSMGAGVASIASAALPVLGYVLAAGVIVYSVVGLANAVMDMYDLLSAEAKAELEQIEASGADSYTLSEYEALSSELPGVMENRVGGSLSASFSIDRSQFGVYDASIHLNTPAADRATIFNIPLSSEPVLIEGTSVSISRVVAPFAEFTDNPTFNRCIKLSNASTGISLYLVPAGSDGGTISAPNNDTFYFAEPVIESYVNGSGVEQYWYFHFPMAKYDMWGDLRPLDVDEYNSGLVSSPVYLYFTGTGNPALDEVLFVSQNMYNGVSTLTPSTSAHPGMDVVTFSGSAASIVFSDYFANVGVTDAPAYPEEDKPVFLPPSVALDNANLLTQSGALTGTWDTTIDGEKVETDTETDVPGVDAETGFWESILNWLEGFWDKFVEMLKTALMSLFVPSEGFFEDFIASISATFEDRMGILTYPISLLYEFCNRLLEVGHQEPIFRWPSWSYQGTEFIEAGSFNFNDILKNDTFKGVHDIYLLLVDAGIVFGLLMLAQRKYDSIINN